MTTDIDRALEQAQAQYESIKAMVERLEHARGCNAEDWDNCNLDERLADGLAGLDTFIEYHDEDDAQQAIQEDPLSVEVRSGWTTLDYTLEASEFQILLCTGGPAVRIMGELDDDFEPCRAWLEFQDWGTPWTQYIGSYMDDATKQHTLLAYCREFYFGG